MDTKLIFKETELIHNRIQEAQTVIDEQRGKQLEIRELCSHEIIFKYNDNRPRKQVIDGRYVCPACGKTIQCIKKQQLNETVFKDSRVIPLTHLSLMGTKEVYASIRQEVMENLDWYYNPQIPKSILERKMEEVLKGQDYHYIPPEKIFVKLKEEEPSNP